jgi:hypothetical protein
LLIDRDATFLAAIFVREAIYRSLSRYRGGKGFLAFITKIFMPSIEDNILSYNLKWFLAGVISGYFMSIWVPLVIIGSRIIGLYYVGSLFIISYLIMALLISILIVFDLMHQVISSIRDLSIINAINHLPISSDVVERAVSYSILVGGGFSLLVGMGLSIGLVIYRSVLEPLATYIVPLGFATIILLIYPIAVIVYSRMRYSVSPIISSTIYVAIVVVILALYIYFIGLGSTYEIYSIMTNYRYIFPLPYVYISVNGFDSLSFIYAHIYFVIGLIMSLTIPFRYGIRLLSMDVRSGGSSRKLLFWSETLTLGFKDVYLLLRDSTRQKQFYGQLAAILTPLIIPLLTPSVKTAMSALEFEYSLALIGLYGFVSYILAVIVSPIIIFLEADNNKILYIYPLSREEVIIGKTVASTILYLPVILIIGIILYFTTSPMHTLYMVYLLITYWITGSYLTNKLVLLMLWGKLDAWTELSLGIIRRLIIMVLLMIPLVVLIPLILLYYVYNIYNSLMIESITPLIITLYVLVRTIKG